MLKKSDANIIKRMPLFICGLWHIKSGGSMSYDVQTHPSSGLDYLNVKNNGKYAVVLFHGYGASMMDLYDLHTFLGREESIDWFFPNGPLDISMGMGMMSRGWFPIDVKALEQAMQTGTHRDFSKIFTHEFNEALSKSETFLEDLVFNKYDKVILGGFSQGAMLTSHLSVKNSHMVDGLICYSGNLVGQTELVKALETSKKFPFFQSHGKRDPILGYEYAKQLFELLKLGGHQGEFVGFDGVHEIPVEILKKSDTYLKKVLSS